MEGKSRIEGVQTSPEGPYEKTVPAAARECRRRRARRALAIAIATWIAFIGLGYALMVAVTTLLSD